MASEHDSEHHREHDYEPESPAQGAPPNEPSGVGESNPNASGPERLKGDMGVSSERPGPAGGERSTDRGIEGTGTAFSTAATTSGETETFPGGADPGPDPSAGRDDDPRPEGEGRGPGADRTVGEDNTAEVPPHANHPSKNPGHSHGT